MARPFRKWPSLRLTPCWEKKTYCARPALWWPDTTRHFRLKSANIAALYALIGMRLAVSVTNSAHRKTVKPGDPYVTSAKLPHGKRWSDWQKFIRASRTTPFAPHVGLIPCRKSARRSTMA